jgi:hypothetical protein
MLFASLAVAEKCSVKSPVTDSERCTAALAWLPLTITYSGRSVAKS